MAGSIFRRLYRGETRIDFIGHRKRWYLASGVILLICVLSFAIRGFNYSIDFTGGTQFTISDRALTSNEVNTAFTRAGENPENPPQLVGSGSDRRVVVQTKSLSQDVQQSLQADVAKDLNIAQSKFSVESVSSDWGHSTTVDAIKGLIVFLIVVCAYIAIRFEWRMAVGGIIALFHDIVVAAGVYSLVGFEVSPSTIVGLLTILGFSLYDTVVVYDKVSENSKGILAGSRMTYTEAANLAVNQTLMRSINTSLISLLPVAGLLFVGVGVLGIGTIKDLALVLFVGLLSGAYSSLFIATPIVVDLTEHDPKYKALTRRVAQKRAAEAKRGVTVVPGATTDAIGGPAPAPRVGAKPQRNRPK